jgi:hypothetical protein
VKTLRIELACESDDGIRLEQMAAEGVALAGDEMAL